MLKIIVNESRAYIERGDTDPETTLAELMVACQGVLEDVSKRTKTSYGVINEIFIRIIK